ncbi:MAG: hypothetical protein J5998_01665 [Clostridia bacterium]|nr:hypothetical protein [Clostridia bacterium]
MDLNETIRRAIMAGVGAVSLTVEKSKDIADTLVRKGEEATAGKNVSYEQLRDQVAEQVKAFTEKLSADLKKASFEELLDRVDDLTDEQRAILADRLAHPLKEDESCACGGEEACDYAKNETCEAADGACAADTAADEAREESADKPE